MVSQVYVTLRGRINKGGGFREECGVHSLREGTMAVAFEPHLKGKVGLHQREGAVHDRARSSQKAFLFPILVSPDLSPPNRTAGL